MHKYEKNYVKLINDNGIDKVKGVMYLKKIRKLYRYKPPNYYTTHLCQGLQTLGRGQINKHCLAFNFHALYSISTLTSLSTFKA